MDQEELNRLTGEILDAAICVHKEMGPGLLESVYEECLEFELTLRGLSVERHVTVPLYYKGHLLKKEYEMDLLVEREVIVELKAVEVVNPVWESQIISHLKLVGKKVGLLINFNVPKLISGYKRFVNHF